MYPFQVSNMDSGKRRTLNEPWTANSIFTHASSGLGLPNRWNPSRSRTCKVVCVSPFVTNRQLLYRRVRAGGRGSVSIAAAQDARVVDEVRLATGLPILERNCRHFKRIPLNSHVKSITRSVNHLLRNQVRRNQLLECAATSVTFVRFVLLLSVNDCVHHSDRHSLIPDRWRWV